MSTKLYVGNLAFSVGEQDLAEVFGEVGACPSIAIITDRESGQSRGFGFIEMTSNADAQKAVQQLDGREVKGRSIKVSIAREKESGGNFGSPSRGNGWSRR